MTKQFDLLPGETAVNYAPNVVLANGKQCIPQHYLKYEHTLCTIESILSDITCDPRYLIFATQEADQLLIQIGVVGPDNYKKHQKNKIVYGRKWRVEPELPSSEVIQTAYLAILKAREHEIRERLTLSLNNKLATPFNNHHDLPLMAQNASLLLAHSDPSFGRTIEEQLKYVKFDDASIEVKNHIEIAQDTWLLQLNFIPTEHSILHEVQSGLSVNLILNMQCFNHFLHKLMEELVLVSNRWIGETFKYKGFARFSEAVSIAAISNLSMVTREPTKDELSQIAHTELNYSVDENRRPQLEKTDYSYKLLNQLQQFGLVDGFKPEVK